VTEKAAEIYTAALAEATTTVHEEMLDLCRSRIVDTVARITAAQSVISQPADNTAQDSATCVSERGKVRKAKGVLKTEKKILTELVCCHNAWALCVAGTEPLDMATCLAPGYDTTDAIFSGFSTGTMSRTRMFNIVDTADRIKRGIEEIILLEIKITNLRLTLHEVKRELERSIRRCTHEGDSSGVFRAARELRAISEICEAHDAVFKEWHIVLKDPVDSESESESESDED
jgi:hypothetical protein